MALRGFRFGVRLVYYVVALLVASIASYNLSAPRWRRFVGAEDCSRVSQGTLNPHCIRVCAAQHLPRGPFRVSESLHGLAEIVERGNGVQVERPRVSPRHRKQEIMILSENTSGHGDRLAHECLGFFEAL